MVAGLTDKRFGRAAKKINLRSVVDIKKGQIAQTDGDEILKEDNRFIEAIFQVKEVRKEAAREKNRGHI